MIRISCQNPSGWPNLRPRGVLEKNENGKSMSGFGRRMDLVFARPFCNIAQGATFVFAFASGSKPSGPSYFQAMENPSCGRKLTRLICRDGPVGFSILEGFLVDNSSETQLDSVVRNRRLDG